MTSRRQFLGGAIAAAAMTKLRFASAGQLDQVNILFGFPPGSAGDSVARRIGERFAGTPYSKHGAIVHNRVGAGGRIALGVLKNSPADGSVLGLTPWSSVAIFPHVYTKLSYDPFKDFTPVSTAAIMHQSMAVGPIVPESVRSIGDFLAWAKANPDKASYGSPAAGTTLHFMGAMLGIKSGVELRHIPYRGSLPGVNDLVGGHIPAMFTPCGDFIQHHKAGKVRVLATSGAKRFPLLEDVPTFAEEGYPEFTVEEWWGFYAPAKTPQAVVNLASAAINAAVSDRTIAENFMNLGLIAQGSTPEEMNRSQLEEFHRWGPIVKRVGFTSDS